MEIQFFAPTKKKNKYKLVASFLNFGFIPAVGHRIDLDGKPQKIEFIEIHPYCDVNNDGYHDKPPLITCYLKDIKEE